MKKKTQQLIEVETAFCNICGKEMGMARVFAGERIAIVYGLFKTKDFDAHETCINEVIRAAFEPYAEVRVVGKNNRNLRNPQEAQVNHTHSLSRVLRL